MTKSANGSNPPTHQEDDGQDPQQQGQMVQHRGQRQPQRQNQQMLLQQGRIYQPYHLVPRAYPHPVNPAHTFMTEQQRIQQTYANAALERELTAQGTNHLIEKLFDASKEDKDKLLERERQEKEKLAAELADLRRQQQQQQQLEKAGVQHHLAKLQATANETNARLDKTNERLDEANAGIDEANAGIYETKGYAKNASNYSADILLHSTRKAPVESSTYKTPHCTGKRLFDGKTAPPPAKIIAVTTVNSNDSDNSDIDDDGSYIDRLGNNCSVGDGMSETGGDEVLPDGRVEMKPKMRKEKLPVSKDFSTLFVNGVARSLCLSLLQLANSARNALVGYRVAANSATVIKWGSAQQDLPTAIVCLTSKAKHKIPQELGKGQAQ